jgi:predicted N-acyltransferase
MFTLHRYINQNESRWDQFVSSGNNGTLFHLRKFLNYHPKDRFQDHSILIEKKQNLFSVLPAAELIVDGKRILVSHPGSTVGSFVVPENLSIADAMSMSEALVTYVKENNFSGIRITLPPTLYQRRLSNYIDFSFFKHGFTYSKRDVTSILFLEDSLDKNLAKFKSSHRQAVRNAQEKGVNVRQSNDFDSFYHILEQNLNIRHGVTPTHTLAELKNIHTLFPDRVNLFAAFVKDVMVAGVVNFVVNDHVVLAFYISHDEAYQEFRAVNLLFYSIFDWAIQQGFRIYDFGTFTVNEEPNMGLGRFKENFGASGVFRDTIELKLS